MVVYEKGSTGLRDRDDFTAMLSRHPKYQMDDAKMAVLLNQYQRQCGDLRANPKVIVEIAAAKRVEKGLVTAHQAAVDEAARQRLLADTAPKPQEKRKRRKPSKHGYYTPRDRSHDNE